MNQNEVGMLKKTFDDYKKVDEDGKVYWEAHDLAKAMGYSEYSKFKPAIDRAKQSMESTGKDPDDHLARSGEMISVGKGAIREVPGYKLDKYGAYLTAMNADPSKEEVAFAQEYFLQNTAKAEVIGKRLEDKEYIEERESLKTINKLFAATLLSQDVPEEKLGVVLNAGDKGFFDKSTKEVKESVGIPENKPVADILGPDLLTAKKAAQMFSRREIMKNDVRGTEDTAQVTYENNRLMRELVEQKLGDTPENLIPYEDVKKVEKKYNRKTSALLKKLEEEEF